MSKRISKTKRYDNTLTELAAALKISNLMTGGSTLSSYGTIGYSNNYSLITFNRIMLTYLYTGNGIFQTAIQLPVQDALSKDINFDSPQMDGDDIKELQKYLRYNGIKDLVINAESWSRLFGGAAIIVNTNQDPETPLNLRALYNQPIDFYAVDRWQLSSTDIIQNESDSVHDWEYFYLYGQKIHKSRVIPLTGKQAPSYVRRQLRGWGMSEGERMIRDLNNYLKTGDVLYDILDESKVDVYKIKGFNSKLLTAGGSDKMKTRIQLANEIKNYVHALIMDTEDDFEQKTMTFGGLAEVMRENRINVSAALRMPMTKLFGLSSSGFNAGEDDLEQYNQNVESEVRSKLDEPLSKLLTIIMAHIFGYVPDFDFAWEPMRVLKATEEEALKTSKQARYTYLYELGIIDARELGQILETENLLPIETKASKGLISPFPMPPADPEGETKEPQMTTVKSPSSRGVSGKG